MCSSAPPRKRRRSFFAFCDNRTVQFLPPVKIDALFGSEISEAGGLAGAVLRNGLFEQRIERVNRSGEANATRRFIEMRKQRISRVQAQGAPYGCGNRYSALRVNLDCMVHRVILRDQTYPMHVGNPHNSTPLGAGLPVWLRYCVSSSRRRRPSLVKTLR